jgi:hypothetical protein
MALPFPLDPRLVLRALDDLHAIAVAARELPEVEERLTAQLRNAELELRAAREMADARSGELLAVLERLEATVVPLQGTAERLGRLSELFGRR